MALDGVGDLHCRALSQSRVCTLQVDGMQLIDALQKEEYQDVPIIGEQKQGTRLTIDTLTLPADSLHCSHQRGAAPQQSENLHCSIDTIICIALGHLQTAWLEH